MYASLSRYHSLNVLTMRGIGDQVTNLREDIFMHRIKYSLTSTMDEEERDMFLDKAVKSLEK